MKLRPPGGAGTLKNVIVYVGLALLFGVPVAVLFQLAPGWVGIEATSMPLKAVAAKENGLWDLLTNLHKTPAGLLLQIMVVVVAAKCAGAATHMLGQPRVIGEMF